MSDIKNLIDLENKINSGENLQKDMTEAINLIKKMFEQKYISKLQNELELQKQSHQKNPTKEIQLIQAVKPFISQDRHSEIDKITDTLINITTLIDIQNDLIKNKQEKIKEVSIMSKPEVNDKSIKKDGIYDLDENCLLKQQSTKIEKTGSFYMYIILFLILMSDRK